jgi:quercetin dioxygenase-like cupin family protein
MSSAATSQTTQPHVAQAEGHQQLEWIGGSTMTVLLDAATTGDQLMVARTVLRRGGSAPLHVHSAEDGLFLMLKGAGTFWVGDERYEVREGGLAWLPRDLPHTYRIDSNEAHVLTLCTPGGLEGFFRAASHDLAASKPENWAITPQTMGAALAAHGGTVVGPPKGADD